MAEKDFFGDSCQHSINFILSSSRRVWRCLHFTSSQMRTALMGHSESQVGGPKWVCLIPTEDIEKTRDQLVVALEAGEEELLQIYICIYEVS